MFLNELFQSLDPIAFSLGPLSVRWYGLAYLAGFIVTGFVMCRVARRWDLDLSVDDIMSIVIGVAFGVIIGARLGYCLLYGDGYYLANPMEILALGNGGMSFHGGLVGIVVAGVIYSLVYNVPFLTLADLVSCGVPLGLLFGRCANFVNGELYGAPTTLPIGVDFTGSGIMYHPSQLYEALLEGLVIFLVLFALSRKSNPPRPRGFFLGTFLTLYGVFRILIEFVRLPDVQIGYFFGTWGTMGQLLSLPMVVVGICLIAWSCVRKLPQRGMPAHKA